MIKRCCVSAPFILEEYRLRSVRYLVINRWYRRILSHPDYQIYKHIQRMESVEQRAVQEAEVPSTAMAIKGHVVDEVMVEAVDDAPRTMAIFLSL